MQVHAVFRCQSDSEATVIVRTEAAWRSAWQQCAGLARDPFAADPVAAVAPAVDFDRHMVVGYHWGMRPSTGYEVLISNVWASRGVGVLVDVVRLAPGPTCGVYAVVLPAGQLVVVDRLDSDPAFVFRDATVAC